jgi:HlyD family secretion protein
MPTAGRGMPGGGGQRAGGQRAGGQGQGQGQGQAAGAEGGEGAKRGPGVYVMNGTELRRVPVEIGATDGIRTEVKSPEISPGTEVVVSATEVTGG